MQRHAENVATVSEHSRRDIIDRLALFPDSVSVIPMPLHPCYVHPNFSPGFVSVHGIHQPYILCVGCIEPRKNLRRLVRAFELLTEEEAARHHVLVLVGPQGWDEGFSRVSGGQRRVPANPHARFRAARAPSIAVPFRLGGYLPERLRRVRPSGSRSDERLECCARQCDELAAGSPRRRRNPFDPYRTEGIAAAMLQALSMTPAEAAEYRRRSRARADTLFERTKAMPPLPGLSAEASMAIA